MDMKTSRVSGAQLESAVPYANVHTNSILRPLIGISPLANFQ